MPNKYSAFIAISLLALLLISSLSIVATASSATSASSSSGAKETPPYFDYFYGSSLASAQPSPYCNIGTASAPFDLMCYTPQDIKRAYNYPPTTGPNALTGAGQTIVIIDAYGSPTVQSDLNTFDTEFGLPATTIQYECEGATAPTPGACPFPSPSSVTYSDAQNWGGEIALDTQYSHAMAPGAKIVLFETYGLDLPAPWYTPWADDDYVMAEGALQAVTAFPHSIISQSWGDSEQDILLAPSWYITGLLSTSATAYSTAARTGTTVFASAGDWGADNCAIVSCTAITDEANPLFPSSSPWVTAVGGTMGNPYYLGPTTDQGPSGVPTSGIPTCNGRWICSTGLVNFLNSPSCQLDTLTPTATASCIPVGYGGEQVWNEPFIDAATGGAPSLIFPVPSYQAGLKSCTVSDGCTPLTGRATPDISYNAAVSGGVLTVISGEWYIVGGTSAGSPQWSAIAALADQFATEHHGRTIGFINPTLYMIGHIPSLYSRDFHDIAVGNNEVYTSPDNVGFTAQKGWDDASGWGTPNVANLIPDLVFLTFS